MPRLETGRQPKSADDGRSLCTQKQVRRSLRPQQQGGRSLRPQQQGCPGAGGHTARDGGHDVGQHHSPNSDEDDL